MGAICSCFQVEDFHDYMNPNSSVYRNCICLRCFIQSFLNMYYSVFRRGEVHGGPSSIQGPAAMASTASLDNSLVDFYRSPPRPMPYDAVPRYFSRQEKGSSQSYEEREPLRGDSNMNSELVVAKWKDSSWKDVSKNSKSSLIISQSYSNFGNTAVDLSAEDEDVCPTCLEEYTSENPKIMTKCSHHFHLSCIYEWMERSDTCPVCGQEMEFDETT